jgi:hypothetical protein
MISLPEDETVKQTNPQRDVCLTVSKLSDGQRFILKAAFSNRRNKAELSSPSESSWNKDASDPATGEFKPDPKLQTALTNARAKIEAKARHECGVLRSNLGLVLGDFTDVSWHRFNRLGLSGRPDSAPDAVLDMLVARLAPQMYAGRFCNGSRANCSNSIRMNAGHNEKNQLIEYDRSNHTRTNSA